MVIKCREGIEINTNQLVFLRQLSAIGIEFDTSQIDGMIIISPEEVVEYAKSPDLFFANRAGVPLDDWLRWRDYILTTHKHTPLAEFLSTPLKICYERLNISAELRWEVWERDGFTCKICGTQKLLSIDHIIPISKGGQTKKDNLQTLCRNCNSKKGAKNAQ